MEYTLLYSDRRTLCIEIDRNGAILVRAPRGCPQSRIDSFLVCRRSWIEKHLLLQMERPNRPEPTEEERLLYLEKAQKELPSRTAYYAARMQLSYAGIRITGAKKRFGSCSGTDHLCFSWRLMQYPDAAIDYVVVHELAHIVHKNHGKAFYALIAEILPDWKTRRALLRD